MSTTTASSATVATATKAPVASGAVLEQLVQEREQRWERWWQKALAERRATTRAEVLERFEVKHGRPPTAEELVKLEALAEEIAQAWTLQSFEKRWPPSGPSAVREPDHRDTAPDVHARMIGTTHAHQRGGGEPRPSSRKTTRTSSSSDSGGSDSESAEPPPRRLCENCAADLSHRPKADFCSNACKQHAYRDRRTVEHLDELVGTVAVGVSCECAPKGHLVIGGVCFTCGKPRGVVTRDWLDDDMRARSFVSSRAPARRNPRYGDGKRKPPNEFTDESIIKAVAA